MEVKNLKTLTCLAWSASSYTLETVRPLCMLDTIGKIFEQVVAERMRKHFQGKRALSADQYGFRAGCSTINAATKPRKFAAVAIQKRQLAQL